MEAMLVSVDANEGHILHWFVPVRYEEHEWPANVFILLVQTELSYKDWLAG